METVYWLGALALLLIILLLAVVFRSRKPRRRHIVIGGFGTPSQNLALEIVQAMKRMRILPLLLKVTAVDNNVSTYRPYLKRIVPKGVLFEAKQTDQQYTYGYRGNRLTAMRRRPVWIKVTTQVNDAIVQAARRFGITDPFTIWITGWTGGHITLNIEALRDRLRRLPEELKLLIIVLSAQAVRRNALRETPDLPLRLQKEGLVTTSLLLDNRAGIVELHREATEDTAEVRGRGVAAMDLRVGVGLSSLISGVWDMSTQFSPGDMVDNLGKFSSMSGMSFGSSHLPKLDEPWYEKLLKIFFPQTPAWRDEDLLTTARIAAEDALNVHSGNATVDAEPLPAEEAEWYLIMTVPMPLNDPRWDKLRADFMNWFNTVYKNVTVNWSSGFGAPEFGNENAGFDNIQATAWWPLHKIRIAEPVQAVLDRPDIDRSRVEREEDKA